MTKSFFKIKNLIIFTIKKCLFRPAFIFHKTHLSVHSRRTLHMRLKLLIKKEVLQINVTLPFLTNPIKTEMKNTCIVWQTVKATMMVDLY